MSSIAFAVSVVLIAAGAKVEDPYEAFARGVERGVEQGRPDALPLDLDALGERVTAGVPAPEALRAGFLAGMKKSGADRSLGKQLAESVRGGGSVRLLRVRPEKGEGRALFRVLGSSGVNYLDLHLQRAGPSKVRVVDCYVFISGETLSQTMRRMYLLAVSEADMSLLDRLVGKEREFLKNVGALKEMQRAQQEKRHADVIAAYDKLPASLKRERIFLLPRFAAAAALGDEKQYRRAIEDFEQALPDDPSLDLVSIDGHVLRKQYDRALAAVDRLDSRVGDPYLDFMRGSILVQKGDRAGARQRFRTAIAGEPAMPAPYWAMIELAMQEKDFRSTAELLTAVERDAGVELANLEEVPAYADFVKSKEYGSWKARRGKKTR